jgi:hypothetical protein
MKKDGNFMEDTVNKEISRLSKGFKPLNANFKKGVLKTAQRLLRIQRAHKRALAKVAVYSVPSAQKKK